MLIKHFSNSLLFCVCTFIILLGGCSTHVPKPASIDVVGLENINKPSSINIINDQSNKEEILIGKYGMGSLRGDLHSWTGSAIKLLQETIEKKGITVSDTAQKTMKVKVVEAKVDTAGIPMVASLARCKILLSVETGDGYIKTYEAINKGINPPSASDKAMGSVVSNLLQDQAILEYLKK